MNSSRGFSLGNSLNAMDSRLVAHLRKNAVAFDHRECFFDTANTGVSGVQNLHLPALTLGVACIHPEHLCCKERRFIAAGSGTNFEDDVLLIIRIAGKEKYL